MKQEQLLTLCQRHHAVLLSNAADELSIAVVGTPPGELMMLILIQNTLYMFGLMH